MPYIYFISDLHLNAKAPEVADAFIAFLKRETSRAKALYILGDFFEIWLGDDMAEDFETRIIEALAESTQAGLAIYFIHGNRDFLIGKKFIEKTGIQVLQDPSVVDLFGKKWMLSHGDYLCTRDQAHMFLRKITLNSISQFLFLNLPLCLRKKIAEKIRGKSRQHKKSTRLEYMDVEIETVKNEMRRNSCQNLIHGHTHEGKIHEFQLDEKMAYRIVLGDWHETAKILKYSQNGEFSLEILECQ